VGERLDRDTFAVQFLSDVMKSVHSKNSVQGIGNKKPARQAPGGLLNSDRQGSDKILARSV
jgi:hypothetical protein